MSFNIGQALGGPALIKNRGVTGYTAGAITTSYELDTFDVPVEPFGKSYRKRTKGTVIKIKFRPSGRIIEALSYIGRYANKAYGSLISPERYPITSADATTDLLTLPAHNIVYPELVMFSGSTLPAPVTTAMLLAARSASGTTLMLHDTVAHAVANTNKTDLTSAGSSGSFIDISRSLLIHAFDGTWVKFHNVGLTGVPTLKISTGETMLGDVEFTAYPKLGTVPGAITAGSFYETGVTALNDTSFPTSDLPSVVPIVTLAGDPGTLGSIYFTKGLSIDVKPNFTPIEIDGLGVAAHQFSDCGVELKGQPFGLAVEQVAALVGTEEAPGTDNAGFATSVAIGNAMTFALASSRARSGETMHGSETQRAGDLTIYAQRNVPAGTADPLFTFAAV